jgi:hypothetical protein
MFQVLKDEDELVAILANVETEQVQDAIAKVDKVFTQLIDEVSNEDLPRAMCEALGDCPLRADHGVDGRTSRSAGRRGGYPSGLHLARLRASEERTGEADMSERLSFAFNCVGAPDVQALSECLWEARDITRKTFRSHVDTEQLREIELGFGYVSHPKQGLTMAGDFHVRYCRSRYKGRTCYYFVWSAFEYIFLPIQGMEEEN